MQTVDKGSTSHVFFVADRRHLDPLALPTVYPPSPPEIHRASVAISIHQEDLSEKKWSRTGERSTNHRELAGLPVWVIPGEEDDSRLKKVW